MGNPELSDPTLELVEHAAAELRAAKRRRLLAMRAARSAGASWRRIADAAGLDTSTVHEAVTGRTHHSRTDAVA
jgi:hypothetical protein